MTEMPVGETAEFIALAATLLLIKSRSLLPTLTITEEESRDIRELEYRLAVYQLIKEAAVGLRVAQGNPALFEGTPPKQDPLFLFDQSITLEALRSTMGNLIANFPTTAALPQVKVRQIVSIEDMIERLSDRVSSAFRLSFREFSGVGRTVSPEQKQEVIVSFLALLELVKQGILRANQADHFGDIILESDSVSIPSYE